jgi:hypothetical protein
VAALVVAVASAAGASSALATSSTNSANGVSVSASLAPDSVKKGDTVSEDVQVKNVSDATENLSIRIVGPLPTAAPTIIGVTLQPGKVFERSGRFPAALLSPGTHTLTVIAVNRASGQGSFASASVNRT